MSQRYIILVSVMIFVGIFFSGQKLFSQPTFSTSGDWSTPSNWTPAVVPTGATTAVDIGNGFDPTVSTSGNVIGSVYAKWGTIITVDASGSLTMGSQSDFDLAVFAELIFDQGSTINVNGSLIIYGDLTVKNNLILNVTGVFKVYGDVIMKNGADLSVSGGGSLIVEGSLTGGTNTDIVTSGVGSTIAVGGDIAIASGTIIGAAGSITVGGTCTPSGICAGTVTPIELLYFSGSENNNTVILNWATATEENFDFFEIERACQGRNFEFIGEVKGDGNSFTRLDYNFEDNNPEIGLNYYRLKSIDLDGTYEYSDVILVKFTSNVKLVVSPNPTFGIVSVKTSIPTTDGLKYEITNQYGVVVLTGELSAFNNQIDLQGLTKGIYIIRLVDLPTVKAKRIILK